MVWTFIYSARWIFPAFEVKLAAQTSRFSSTLQLHYNFMADGNPILAALELKAPCANHLCSFRVSDTVLTAAMLAGGTDPIQKLMDTFRKFMKAPSARGKGTME
jgi:hypothetical protein